LVALEGIDGAGKSTQSRWLAAELARAGYPVVEEHEPTGGVHGALLRRLVAEGGKRLPVQDEFRLFLLDRHDNQCRTVLPALRRGAVVLLDRYYISSMAYQGARGLDPREIRRANEHIALVPDLLVLFELTPEAGRRRRAGRAVSNNDFEHPEEQARVADILADIHDDDFPMVVRIQADGTPAQVSSQLAASITAALTRVTAEGTQWMDRRFWDHDPALPAQMQPVQPTQIYAQEGTVR
jgi:dTMP kinase